MRTQIGLLNRHDLWLLCALVFAVAIAGKYIGTYVAARVSGINNREASAQGWLMNTRGLTELIVLNIGLELGVIWPLVFTMLVIMALVTTFMTSPLLEWTYPKRLIKLGLVEPQAQEQTDINAANEGESYQLLFNIQQSGIYLNASLLPANANADTDKQHSLTGLFQNQHSSLSGKVERYLLCNTPVSQSDRNKLVTMQMKLVDQGKITGQLTVNGISQSLGFTAMLQKNQEKSQKLNSH